MKWLIGLLIYLSLVGIRYQNSLQAKYNLDQWVGQENKFKLVITSEPKLEGNSQSFYSGRIKVVTGQYPKYEYGEKVEVFGILQRRVINKWLSQFSLMYPEIIQLEADSNKSIGFWFRNKIINFRTTIAALYNRYLPEPEASLLSGIVLGLKRSLPVDFWQSLQRTSTLHIVVASGYNVTVVMGTMIFLLAGRVKRSLAIGIGLIGVMIYTLMAGAEPAIVRAAIMGSLTYLAQILGREADGMRALIVAVGAMVLVKPLLIWDIGFQLSVMATGGLVVLGSRWQSKLIRFGSWGQDVATTLAAQVMVWPILVINFGQMSLFGILINSLILWLVPIIMGLGAGVGLTGLVFPWLGQVLSWLVYVPLTAMVNLINWFSQFEWVSWQVEGLNWWWGLGYYLSLGGLIWRCGKK